MGRVKLPIEIAELRGSVAKNPQRYRNRPPKSDKPLGDPPGHLGNAAGACWLEIEAAAVPGVLTGADRFIVEIAANLLAQYREDPPAFQATRLRLLASALAKIGMTPVDRQNVVIPKPEPAGDDFE